MADSTSGTADFFGQILKLQSDAVQLLFGTARKAPEAAQFDPAHWAKIAARLQAVWADYYQQQAAAGGANLPLDHSDPAKWLGPAANWYKQLPFGDLEAPKRLWDEGVALWQGVLGQYGIGPKTDKAPSDEPLLLRSDRRFADPKWREQPFFAVLHQSYLLLAEQLMQMAEKVEGLDPDKHEQLRFATRTLVEALSPDHFPLTNPLVIERAIETKGESLVRGMENLVADMKRGQLSHTDPNAFKLGENIAVTPGKVVHEAPLYQLIQYAPVTQSVLATPVVIFPPWINRFYILDLNPKKSFVRWAVEQGLTVFMVSWKSADASMAEVVWDDYIRAQIEAVDVIRARLKAPSVHAIGYCVAGTTLAATLAVLARRGEAEKVKSATFFTAQVDFEQAGELKNFIDDQQIALMGQLSPEGYLDGRYMATTFNLLRGNDLIWSYVVKNYLLGEDYPAFDLLHWNGDTTNLPIKWHKQYLQDLYRDNRLVVPDTLSADGTPIDLRRVQTPTFVQAGKEDHIAPPESVWRTTHHFSGPVKFVLAGSGHIAGVVNPPSANKYQYWTNDKPAESLDAFVSGAVEHPGSWWPHWLSWLEAQDNVRVPAKGKRKPGGKGDVVIEDAPGSYVRIR